MIHYGSDRWVLDILQAAEPQIPEGLLKVRELLERAWCPAEHTEIPGTIFIACGERIPAVIFAPHMGNLITRFTSAQRWSLPGAIFETCRNGKGLDLAVLLACLREAKKTLNVPVSGMPLVAPYRRIGDQLEQAVRVLAMVNNLGQEASLAVVDGALRTLHNPLQNDLLKVRNLISEHTWCRGKTARDYRNRGCEPDSDHARKWCLMGAIEKVVREYPKGKRPRIRKALIAACGAEARRVVKADDCTDRRILSRLNDDAGLRTIQAVVNGAYARAA